MIRINLLRQKISVGGALTPEKPNIGILALGIFALTLVGMGWWWWQLSSELSTKQQQVEQLQTEARRLVDVKKQVTQFELQKKLLEERITIIERLKNNQTGPVNLLQSVLTSIPDRPSLWLTDLTQKNGKVTLQGRALDVPSIADFIANLGRSRSLKFIELAYWQEEEPAIKFELNCTVR
jgi:type IV pilus assembly protein PilN